METPEFFDTTTTIAGFLEKHRFNNEDCADNFIVEELLDLPNDDAIGGIEVAMTDLSTDCCNSSSPSSFSTTLADPPHFHPPDIFAAPTPAPAHFSNDFLVPVPYEDLAELEWLLNFVEESFSSDDLQKQQLIQLGMKAQTQTEIGDHTSQTPLYQFHPNSTIRPTPIFNSEMPVPAKTRSKRSRATPGNWTSRLLAVSHNPNSFSSPATISSSSESDKKPVVVKQGQHKKKLESSNNSREGRKCLHCATDKTPQWRTGPMGPKTLCNACGVRYKSGRLVREYRPTASPTFVLTKHSSSHRKVMELRRQKELMKAQQQHDDDHHHQQHFLHHHQSMMFDVSSSNVDDYLIHQHIGPDFRQII